MDLTLLMLIVAGCVAVVIGVAAAIVNRMPPTQEDQDARQATPHTGWLTIGDGLRFGIGFVIAQTMFAVIVFAACLALGLIGSSK